VNTVRQTIDKARDRRAVMYLRVAPNNRANQQHDLAAQREACKHEAERLGVTIIERSPQ
jgi:hypothetical protein